jgi:hypothetical protein
LLTNVLRETKKEFLLWNHKHFNYSLSHNWINEWLILKAEQFIPSPLILPNHSNLKGV